VSNGATITITGVASDVGGGSVDGVEVSVDGGATWNLATDTSAWSYT
jgi:Big-like domain-containing protein